jgi:hypothetical protein
MTKLARFLLCVALAALTGWGYDLWLRQLYQAQGSPLLYAPTSLGIARWHDATVTNLLVLALSIALVVLAAWVLSAPKAEIATAQRRAIGEDVLDGALQRVKADVPLSPEVEAKAVNGFWRRFERLFGG